MNIAIIGGGWVGCHIASKLLVNHNVTLFEKNESIFNETSSNNQNRLHLGFHYSRNFKTRELCRNTFDRFLSDYKLFTSKIKNNLYCVSKKNSIVDYQTYLKIFDKHEFSETNFFLNNTDGCIVTDERYINFKNVKSFFLNSLKNIIVYKEIKKKDLNELSKKYDLVINCTNNNLKIKNDDSFFELTISLIYKKIKSLDFGALTMVDGDLFSIYPYDEDLYTVTDVIHTPIKKFKNIKSLNKFRKKLNDDDVDKIKLNIESKIEKYYPNFLEDFIFHGFFLSTKSKFLNESGDRSPIITIKDNVVNCFTGKIQGVYIIEDYIKKLIGE